MKEYRDLLEKLYLINLHKGCRLGLEAMKDLDQALGQPSQAFEVIHVAGTNGKGSVAWKTAAALQSQGIKVGLFTSPHIASFRERIRVGGELISEEALVASLTKIFHLIDQQEISPTFFEVTTALAFDYFRSEKVDIAVVEVGIGGRLDATNIVSPKATAITSVGLDHCEILGHSLLEIAIEKAGIIKDSVPVILGPTVPEEITVIAKEKKAPCSFLKDENFIDVDFQNRVIAQRLCSVAGFSLPVEDAVFSTKPPLRQQRLRYQNREILVDVAHNGPSFEALMAEKGEQEAVLILALGRNKDPVSCFKALEGHVSHLILANSCHPRVLPASDLLHTARSMNFSCELAEDISGALEKALQISANKTLIIAGSFFMMAEVQELFQIHRESDPWELNEVLPPPSQKRSVV